MRARSALAAAAAGAMLIVLPGAALAQDTTGDPNDLDSTFVPGADAGASDAAADTGSDDASAGTDSTDDELPQTGGGLALLGGLAVAGGAAVSRRRA